MLTLPDKPSIAVLPFANMSGDPEQEYFADGMVEDILTALSRVRAVRHRPQFELHLQGFSEPGDLTELRDACRLGLDIALRKPLDTFRGDRIAPKTGADSDAQIEAWIRATAITVNHPSGTCAMGRGERSVLNPRPHRAGHRAPARR